ncbi:hypothetical protein Nepgr_020119 [Nepenthes gracilis]|uniref:Uncharacterized protein n=1 Tax=Nepenthes gracilis TaxID=150966 RepID=A0AAD3SVD8_NEPGR|nr:hypothetical protein Nepgr_020119 [Nepenthes gracilis]
MDKEKPSSSGRKVKFTPKAPQRRAARPAERKSEIADEDAEAQRLLRRFNVILSLYSLSLVQLILGWGCFQPSHIYLQGNL